MTIADKLQSIQNTKTAIKNAIVDKGVDIADSDTFASYAGKIGEISGGGSAVIQPEQVNGLCLYLDGQCNTRDGVDHTYTGLQNLVYTVPNTTSFGYVETLNVSGNTWDGDFLKLSDIQSYPSMKFINLTLEAVIKVTDDTENGMGVILANFYGTAGFTLQRTQSIGDYFRFGVYVGSTMVNTLSDVIDVGKIYYIAVTVDTTTNKIVLLVNGKKVEQTVSGVINLSSSASYPARVGSNTTNNNTAPSGTGLRCKGFETGMLRAWNRVLSDEEIAQNYQDAKIRFGIVDEVV